MRRGTSPLIPAAQVDAGRRNGNGIGIGNGLRSPPPEQWSNNNNSLQLPPAAGRHRSASPSNGFIRATSPRSPNMTAQGLFPPLGGGFNSFESLGPGDESRSANSSHPSPGANSSYSFREEAAEYGRLKAAKRQGSVASSSAVDAREPPRRRTAKRKGVKRNDDDAFRRGDDDTDTDSDENPDPNVGVARNGSLRPKRRSVGPDLGNGAQPYRPSAGNKHSASMAAVPEDEGLEHDDFMDKDVDMAATFTPASPLGPQRYHITDEATTLPHTYRQPSKLDHLSRNARRWARSGVAWARGHSTVAMAALLGLLWLTSLVLYSSSRSAPSRSPVAKPPLPDNFDALVGRLGGLESSHAKFQSDADGMWNEVDDRLSRLETEQDLLTDIKNQQAALMADTRQLQRQHGVTEGRVGKLEHRVDSLEVKVDRAINDRSLGDALRRMLPTVVPVVRGQDGGWDIDETFFAVFLKRLLYGTGSAEQEIRHLVNQGVVAERQRWSIEWNTDAQRLEERLTTMLSHNTGDVDVPREQFVELLEEKIRPLWRELKTVQASGKAAPASMKIVTSKGDDLTSVLQGIVDASLVRYSNDQLGLKDYALFSAGARVIEEITTPRLQIAKVGLINRRLWGEKDVFGRPPQVALHPDNSVGQCWSFQGSQGQLGVLLSETDVAVSAITIEHVAMALATDITSAPKDIEVVSYATSRSDRVDLTWCCVPDRTECK